LNRQQLLPPPGERAPAHDRLEDSELRRLDPGNDPEAAQTLHTLHATGVVLLRKSLARGGEVVPAGVLCHFSSLLRRGAPIPGWPVPAETESWLIGAASGRPGLNLDPPGDGASSACRSQASGHVRQTAAVASSGGIGSIAPRGCLVQAAATTLFGVPMLILFLTVSIGLAYGADSPLLLIYGATLLAGLAFAWRAAAGGHLLGHAVTYATFAAAVIAIGTALG
jgi:hypothetical protein